MKTSSDGSHRPGAISAFFVYKAALFAACFWTWLTVLAVRGVPVSGWYAFAAAGAATTTLVGVVLGVRFAMQRDAAQRHEEVMRTLVEISWHTFAAGSGPSPSGPGSSGPGSYDPSSAASDPDRRNGGADVIRFAPDAGPHPRRDSPRSLRG